MKLRILIPLIVLWFAFIVVVARAGLFKSPGGSAPSGVGLAFALPLLVYLLTFYLSPAVRSKVSTLSPVFLVSLHAWRFVGMGFIMAYYRDLLPPGFAWPAGLGDIAVAASAPYVAYRVSQDKTWVRSGWFLSWNVFGILDFLTAVGLGVAHQAAPSAFNTSISMGLMQELPFALIPCFFVPLLGITHFILLYQARGPLYSANSGQLSMGSV